MPFGQTVIDVETQRRYTLSEMLKGLEARRSQVSSLKTMRGVLALEALLRSGPSWVDSQGSISSSFLNLIRDEDINKPYLSYHDITRRLLNLKAYAASGLTPEEARAENVGQLQRLVSAESAESGVQTGIRLNRSGGLVFETARELPEPFTEEAIRRGGQAKRAGQEIWTELRPVAERQRQELERRELTNTVMVGTSIGLLVFMKNKMLAGLLIAGIVYFFKKDAVEEIQQDMDDLTGDLKAVRRSIG
jgi:hypothetical protein